MTQAERQLIDPLKVVDRHDRRTEPTYGSVDRLEEAHRLKGRRLVVRHER